MGTVISLSCEALLEAGSFVEQIERLCLWSDPWCKSDNATKLIENIFNQSLADHVGSSITAKTLQGAESWGRLVQRAPDYVAGCFKFQSGSTTQLIDKKNIPRVLVDGRREHTNLHLVDVFMYLQELNVEVWCAFDGELKSWMKPDFHINSIPLEESVLYCNAVDCVILCGDGISRQDILAYISCGIVPIPFSQSAMDVLNEVTNCGALGIEGVDKNSYALVDRIIQDTDFRVGFYNQGENELRVESYFTLESISKNIINNDSIAQLYQSDEYQLFKQQYFIDKYGNTSGSTSLKQYIQSRSTIQTLSPIGVSIVNYSGWCIDLTSDSSCSPIPLTANSTSLADIQYSERNDVLEHFNRSTHTLPGFEASFVSFDADLAESEVEIIFINEKKRYGLVEPLDSAAMEATENASLGSKYGQFDENIKCKVETLNVHSRCAFKFSLNEEVATDLLFGIKSASESVTIDFSSLLCLINGENISEICEVIDHNTFILKPTEQIEMIGSNELVVILDVVYPCDPLELVVFHRTESNDMTVLDQHDTVMIENEAGFVSSRCD